VSGASLLGTDWDGRLRGSVVAALADPADAPGPELARFRELQRDYPRRGGKGIRGRLVALSALAHGATLDQAVPVAAALELFQNWVLVHDDVEDDSETRRGRPALHRLAGVPVAINVGDAMHVAMWRLLIEGHVVHRAGVLSEFLAMIERTAEGQHLDLAWVAAHRFDVDEDAYLDMVRRKTATYTVVSPLRLGALLAGRAPDARFGPAGETLGAAFQIRDDVLNLLPDDQGRYGKEFAGDLFEGKRTLVLARAFERLGAADADRLRTLLDRPRDLKTEAEMREALALIESADALRYAQAIAERMADEGLALLQRALHDAPVAAPAGEIVALVRTLAQRDA
jgi:geranylgeranyl diphosphate synthase type II